MKKLKTTKNKEKSTLDLIREDYKNHKEEWNEILDEGTNVKFKACTKKNGSFDYVKMSQMWHSGNW
jgi:hypothetical protein